MEAIILAGGLGTRLRGVLPDLPKPMAPINGRPFLEHQMDYWVKQGVERFILSIGYMSECIKAHFGNHYNGCEIAYAEEITPLGTGGGLLLALEKYLGSGYCLVLNGDTFFEFVLKDFMEFHYSHKSALSVALFEVAANDRYMGAQVRDNGEIISFKSEPGTSQLANGGVYLIDKKQFTQLPWHAGDKFSLEDDLFAYMLESGHNLYGKVFSGSFIDIGVPADYLRAKDVVGVLGMQP
jgi:D-glycero-alpha-D-manno-heptose 1-phosphate guanylyltransferase